MRPVLRRLFLCALQHDNQALLTDRGWETRCLHCRTRLQFALDGEPLGSGSLEHVVPQAWFGKRAASELCATVENDPNHPRNLAVACRRCNQSKGKGPDARGPADPRAMQVIAEMLARRLDRWHAPS